MRVKFTDLSPVTREIKNEYLEAVDKFLDRANFILTPEVSEFEKNFAKIIGVRFAVGVSSGADALYLALFASGINQGDEVIIQGNAYNASVVAILRAGAVPRFVDIDAQNLTLNTDQIEKLINSKTRAILPVHLYGMPNNMAEICRIAKLPNLLVIEDCAQAHLAEFEGKKVGTFGKVNAFSFYPTKNLGAFGDGGILTTDDENIYNKLLMFRNLGQKKKNDHQLLGFNMRLDSLQAIVLNLKLTHLAKWTAARQKAGAYYNQLNENPKFPVSPQKPLPSPSHVYHLYPILVEDFGRDRLQEELLKQGVETGVYYPIPVYCQPFYTYQKVDNCPMTDKVCGKILCLPMYAGITRKEQDYVVEILKKILK